MTKRDFLILAIKLFGLYYALATLFSALPSSIVFSLEELDAKVIAWQLAVLLITVGLFWLLTFKADKLVDFLKLEKGFSDEKIEMTKVEATDLIKAGTFIIGALLLVDNTPRLLSLIFWAMKGKSIGLRFESEDKFNLIIQILNLVIGYLLVTNMDFVAKQLRSGEKK